MSVRTENETQKDTVTEGERFSWIVVFVTNRVTVALPVNITPLTWNMLVPHTDSPLTWEFPYLSHVMLEKTGNICQACTAAQQNINPSATALHWLSNLI